MLLHGHLLKSFCRAKLFVSAKKNSRSPTVAPGMCAAYLHRTCKPLPYCTGCGGVCFLSSMSGRSAWIRNRVVSQSSNISGDAGPSSDASRLACSSEAMRSPVRHSCSTSGPSLRTVLRNAAWAAVMSCTTSLECINEVV